MVIAAVITLAVFDLLLSSSVLADPIASSDLIDKAKLFDNKQVTYQGEVIGDVMIRGEFAWMNVSDGANAIGVWMPASEAEKIKYKGGYKYTGDTVKVTGTFHRACPEHGGDMDIHADTVEIVKPGFERNMTVNRYKVHLAVILLALMVVLAWITPKKTGKA